MVAVQCPEIQKFLKKIIQDQKDDPLQQKCSTFLQENLGKLERRTETQEWRRAKYEDSVAE